MPLACAACKYQRRKCSSECPLAPYFPPYKPKMFQNVHRLFGICNTLKILRLLNPSQKREALSSIIYQANIRDRYPVHGCCGVIRHLEYQICQGLKELHAVHAQLELYQQQQHHQISSTLNDSTSELQLGMGPASNNNALTLFNQDVPQTFNGVAALPIASNQFNSNSDNVGYNLGYVDNGNNRDPMELQSQLVAFQQESTQNDLK